MHMLSVLTMKGFSTDLNRVNNIIKFEHQIMFIGDVKRFIS